MLRYIQLEDSGLSLAALSFTHGIGEQGLQAMKPIASFLLLMIATAAVGMHGTSVFADEVPITSGADTPLPAFVPTSRLRNFATARDDNDASAIATRQAAEALSAKFSDITTNSISKDAPPPAKATAQIPMPPAEADPPHVVTETGEARSFVLSSTTRNEDAIGTRPAPPHPSRLKTQNRRMPRNEIDTSSLKVANEDRGASPNLAVIAKVGLFNFLTNPALWK